MVSNQDIHRMSLKRDIFHIDALSKYEENFRDVETFLGRLYENSSFGKQKQIVFRKLYYQSSRIHTNQQYTRSKQTYNYP